MLFLSYGLKNPHKLKHQPGRTHGFRVRAHGSALRITTSHAQTHFDTKQSHQIGRIIFFDVIEKKKLFFENFKILRKKHSFQHLLTSFRFRQIFEMAFKKNVPEVKSML